jgi:ribose 5-phosphate isomerase RpiB
MLFSGTTISEVYMKIGIANERSTGDKNKDIVSALDGFGYEIHNFGARKTTGDESP